jgi:hypothetical protein
MPPKPSSVRRARKSVRERRMAACLRELTTNFDKVELKAHRVQKQKRLQRKKRLGVTAPPLPEDVKAGRMTPELWRIEAALHRAAGLPAPVPLLSQLEAFDRSIAGRGFAEKMARAGRSVNVVASGVGMMVGFVPFTRLRVWAGKRLPAKQMCC